MGIFQLCVHIYIVGIIQCVKNGLASAGDGSESRVLSNQTIPRLHNSENNVILISFDSFRWDYFDLVDTPVLNSFKKHGVHSQYVINVIPTVTFTNHISQATGLYAESHGFVGNSMYDPRFKSTFCMPTIDPKWWWNDIIEPIWVTNEKQGGLSGVCYWPGFNIDGYKATYYPDRQGKYAMPYHTSNNTMPYQERVDTVMKWLEMDKAPNFVMLYFGMLDTVSHKCGFASSESLHEVSRLDDITGYLLNELAKRKLLDKWNIIITGDHGMINLTHNRINITKYIDIHDTMNILDEGGVVFVWPVEGKTQEIYQKLKNAHPNMTAFLKGDIPEEFHIRNNIRVSPIVLITDEGWRVWTHHHHRNHTQLASHGFLNTYPSMWPLFLARGPAFKKGYFSAPFESVDIYPLMCQILGIQPRPNNGTLASVMGLLLSDPKATSTWNAILIGVFASVLFVLFGMVVFTIAMCCSHRSIKKMQKRQRQTKVAMNELEQTSSLLNDYDDNDNEEICVVNNSLLNDYGDNDNDPSL